jgi:uncharacterized protein
LHRLVPKPHYILMPSAVFLSLLLIPTGVPKAAPPKGFVEMFVAGVLDTEAGPAVILRDQSQTKLLPIMIGILEAQAIQLRLERRRFPRPLTHDLLESIMQNLGGSLVKIQVDDLKDNTFLGTVFVKHGAEVSKFDARPSDSIALALGNGVPIYVSESVLAKASEEPEGVDPSDPKQPPSKEERPHPSLGDPDTLKTL